MDEIITILFEENGNGMSFFVDFDKYKIDRINFREYTELRKKQITIIAYLAEIVYEIAISTRNNVSESPVFQTCLGIS